MAHEHKVYDRNRYFKIDSVTRNIINRGTKIPVLMQYDHNSEILSFEIDRYIEGHDMSLCNKVEVHYTNKAASTRDDSKGVYAVEDLTVSAKDDTKLTFTWLISENVTKYAGTLEFLILFACSVEEVITYRWFTNTYNDISVTTGINNEATVAEVCPDILGQWYNDMINRNYIYEAAIKNGFEGTEEEWYESIVEWAKTTTIWEAKQNKLDWVTEEDVDAILNGSYVGSDDADPIKTVSDVKLNDIITSIVNSSNAKHNEISNNISEAVEGLQLNIDGLSGRLDTEYYTNKQIDTNHYTKSQTLSDDVLAVYGLGDDGTPSQAFSMIGNMFRHCWARRTYGAVEGEEETITYTNGASAASSYNFQIRYFSDGYNVNPATAKITLKHVEDATYGKEFYNIYRENLKKEGSLDFLIGKYWEIDAGIGNTDNYYHVTGRGEPLYTNVGDDYSVYIRAKKLSVQIGEWEYVYSNDRNTYPDYQLEIGPYGVEYHYLGIPYYSMLAHLKDKAVE